MVANQTAYEIFAADIPRGVAALNPGCATLTRLGIAHQPADIILRPDSNPGASDLARGMTVTDRATVAVTDQTTHPVVARHLA